MSGYTKTTAERSYFSTGRIAKVCGVSGRTVCKWIDSGKLPGIRIPGSEDRRVPRAAVVAFMRRNGFELPPDLAGDGSLVLVGAVAEAGGLAAGLPAGWKVTAAADPFDAVAVMTHANPAAVVLSLPEVGRQGAAGLARWVRSKWPAVPVAAVGAGDDGGDAELLAPLGVTILPSLVGAGRWLAEAGS